MAGIIFYIKLIHCTCFKGNAKFLCNKAEILETNLVLDTGREIYTYIIETCSSTIAPHRIFFSLYNMVRSEITLVSDLWW